jgi:hypothetical protein
LPGTLPDRHADTEGTRAILILALPFFAAHWPNLARNPAGVTDNYSLSLYVNESVENFHNPVAAKNHSDCRFDGISLENRYLLWNPADHAVGLTLYVEPRYSGVQAELEEKIILGQRVGDWKWALNLTHATEWDNHFDSTEGEVEVSFGITRKLGGHWYAGVEARDHNELPDYSQWENTAFISGRS